MPVINCPRCSREVAHGDDAGSVTCVWCNVAVDVTEAAGPPRADLPKRRPSARRKAHPWRPWLTFGAISLWVLAGVAFLMSFMFAFSDYAKVREGAGRLQLVGLLSAIGGFLMWAARDYLFLATRLSRRIEQIRREEEGED